MAATKILTDVQKREFWIADSDEISDLPSDCAECSVAFIRDTKENLVFHNKTWE